MEQLELVIHDPTALEGGDFDEFAKDILADLSTISDEIAIEDIDLHEGADANVILAIIGGLFFLGKKIDENLDAWISIAQKATTAFRKIQKKYGIRHICVNGATLVAIERIITVEWGNILSIKKISEETILLNDFSTKPEALYLQAYKVNEKEEANFYAREDAGVFHIFGIRSNGRIVIEYRIDTWGIQG